MNNQIKLFNKKEECCGCSACANICPKGAIKMEADGLGFLYPKIDEAKCIKCGLCKKVCAFNINYDKSLNLNEPKVYAVRHKDLKEIATSRSGAVFIALSDWVLNESGVVYGAGYTGHFRVVHKRAVTKIERNEFKGSKYVQSDLNIVFKQVKTDLENNKYVMFSGTPCQTAGLRSFLNLTGVNTDKLFLIDIVCHGVPSPYFWRDYINYIERKNKQKIIEVNFRDKTKFGWTDHKESFKLEDTYTYTYTFYQHIMFRRSCGVCHFTNLKRPSDITIGDFWGWQKVNPEFNADDKGVSLVLLNTEKGIKLFQLIKQEINFIKSDTEHCMQPNLQHPSVIHPKRDEFEKDYIKYGFVYVAKKYGNLGWKYKVLDSLRKVKNESKVLSWIWNLIRNRVK